MSKTLYIIETNKIVIKSKLKEYKVERRKPEEKNNYQLIITYYYNKDIGF